MVKRRKSFDASARRRRWPFVLGVALPLAVAVLLFTASTITVEADAHLPTPAAMLPPNVPPAALAKPSHHALHAKADPFHGIASWYGEPFDGHLTASGERFNMYAMTACNNMLPFGTVVRVINIENHRSVVVRINDRGKLVPGRIIDLSYGAARRLHFAKSGLALVELQVLSFGKKSHKK